MKKYVASTWYNSIDVVEVDRQTDSSVWIKGRMHRRSSDYKIYFDTFDEGKQWLVKRMESKVKSASASLKYEEKELEKVKALEENEKISSIGII